MSSFIYIDCNPWHHNNRNGTTGRMRFETISHRALLYLIDFFFFSTKWSSQQLFSSLLLVMLHKSTFVFGFLEFILTEFTTKKIPKGSSSAILSIDLVKAWKDAPKDGDKNRANVWIQVFAAHEEQVVDKQCFQLSIIKK
jgi:hypothetical protein